jgi:hypothetical protein
VSIPDRSQDLTLYTSPESSVSQRYARSEILLVLICTFLLSVVLLSWIQFSTTSLVDYDGYYHIKIAELIAQKGIPTDFRWLPYTILDESRFADHHFLFHLLQVPFTYLMDLRLAAKCSSVFFAACAFTFLTWVLLRYRIRYPLGWFLLIFASASPFLYRMSMPRAQSLSLLLQLAAFYLILQKRYLLLSILCVVFVWAYNAFPTIAILVLIGFVTERVCEKRWEFRLLLFAGAGILIGLVVNPYFPNNVGFLWNHIGPKIFAGSYQTSVGSEWYPYTTLKLLELAFVSLLCYAAAVACTNREEWTTDKPRLFWILTATAYLVLLLKSRRFIEYFPPFAVLALAFSVRRFILDRSIIHRIKTDQALFVAVVVALLIFGCFGYSVISARNEVRHSAKWDKYRGASEWLKNSTPANSIVFHADWDDFPMLFFFNTHNRYVVGLDADFMRLKNEPVYRKYEEITQGRMRDPVDYIRKVFRSEYVFTDNDHEALIENLNGTERAAQVYRDQHTTIFRLSGTERRLQPASGEAGL